MNKDDFRDLVLTKGRELRRDMPWRRNTRPYFVLVSEMMLQQTQVDRVIPKFNEFVARFPDIGSLAKAQLADVLIAWSGLGYNRRAKFLHDAAKKIVADFNSRIPSTQEDLVSLPGVGQNTAGAIIAYGFNQPAVFIETNIRTVYFYHFFQHDNQVSDQTLYAMVADMLDHGQPRQWYQALMDYGTYLKKQGVGQISKSAHYKKQPALKGSLREVRGQIVRVLSQGDLSDHKLQQTIHADERFDQALDGLIKDGLVSRTGRRLHLTK